MRILAIGEVLWDIFEGEKHLGGAPFNVAAHLSKLGAETYLFSSIGEDDLGEKILQEMASLNVNRKLVHVLSDKPTGTVNVFLQDGQPEYTIHEDVAWDRMILTPESEGLLFSTQWDAIVFGSLAQRSQVNFKLYQKIFNQVRSRERFFDVNMRKAYCTREILESSLKACSIFKLNDIEVEATARIIYQKSLDLDTFSKQISIDFQISTVVITLGSKGAYVYKDGASYRVPGRKVNVVDTVGAGDSFSAGFLMSYLSSGNIKKATTAGCYLGGFTASQSGAIPEYTTEIKKMLQAD